jgi:hypothetical protein
MSYGTAEAVPYKDLAVATQALQLARVTNVTCSGAASHSYGAGFLVKVNHKGPDGQVIEIHWIWTGNQVPEGMSRAHLVWWLPQIFKTKTEGLEDYDD